MNLILPFTIAGTLLLGLDHLYARVLAWSADSGHILIKISGNGGKIRIGTHVAVFDLGKKTAGLDLTKFNAKSVQP